jgi:plastocyanin
MAAEMGMSTEMAMTATAAAAMAATSTMAASMGMETVHVVQVGSNGSLTFSPNNVIAAVGDLVQFQFNPKVSLFHPFAIFH